MSRFSRFLVERAGKQREKREWTRIIDLDNNPTTYAD